MQVHYEIHFMVSTDDTTKSSKEINALLERTLVAEGFTPLIAHTHGGDGDKDPIIYVPGDGDKVRSIPLTEVVAGWQRDQQAAWQAGRDSREKD